MRRGRPFILPLALLCLLTGACGLRGSSGSVASGPNPRNAIALSVLADSVYLVDPSTGTSAEVVGGLLDFQAGYAAWAPDHVHLAVGNDGIFVLDFRKNAEATVVQGTNLSMPAWSPDGRELAYGDGVSLWTRPVEHAAPSRLRLPATLAALDLDWNHAPELAFAGLRRNCAIDYTCPSTDQSDVWILSPARGDLRRLTRVGHVERPKWAPDGSRILFIRTYPDDQARRELWVVRADGGNLHRILAAQDVLAADWSADGRQLATVRRGARAGTLQLWVGGADGSNAQPVGQPVPGTEATLDW